MNMGRNARFWVWHGDGWVKLTLRPGQTLSVWAGGPTDEGYHSESTTWEHVGAAVRRESCSDSADCDGRHSFDQESYCPLDRLAADENDDSPPFPLWEYDAGRCYDQYAEMAGY